MTFVGTALLCGWLQSTNAADWSQFRGPNHDGISSETKWSDGWGNDAPKRLWKQEVGIGFATVSVADGRVVTIGNKDNVDSVRCFSESSGELLWEHSYASDLGPKYYEGGPGSTPTIDGDRVYVLSKWGDFFSLDAKSGKVVWKRQLVEEEKFEVPDWGFQWLGARSG